MSNTRFRADKIVTRIATHPPQLLTSGAICVLGGIAKNYSKAGNDEILVVNCTKINDWLIVMILNKS